jgi:hypothetical protein
MRVRPMQEVGGNGMDMGGAIGAEKQSTALPFADTEQPGFLRVMLFCGGYVSPWRAT